MALKRPLIFSDGYIREIGTEIIPGMWADSALTQNIYLREMLRRRWYGLTGGALASGAQVDCFTDEDWIESGTYTYDGTNNAVGPVEGVTEETVGSTVAGDANYQTYTFFELSAAPNGHLLTKIALNSSGAANGVKFKRFTVNGSNYDITEIATVNKAGAGIEEFTLGTPHAIPGTGTHYIGLFYPASYYVSISTSSGPGFCTYTTTGDISGNNISFLSNSPRAVPLKSTFVEVANLSLISTPSTGLFTASYAWAMLLIENYDASVGVLVSTATSPDWTTLGALTLLCSNPDPGLAGVELYGTGLVPISGSANRANRIKVLADAGNDTKCYGAFLQVME